MRAFTIKPDRIIDGIPVANDLRNNGRAVLLDKYESIYINVDEKTFGAAVLRIYRAQVSDSNVLIHDPGIEDSRALLFLDIPKMFLGSTGYAIKKKDSDGGFTQFSVSRPLIQILKQSDGQAPKYLAIVEKDSVINIRRFRRHTLKQDLYVWWNGIYPMRTTNDQEIFGPGPFSRFLPEHYENVL